jgi:ABC-type polar amino acid transport system ATPase subunit
MCKLPSQKVRQSQLVAPSRKVGEKSRLRLLSRVKRPCALQAWGQRLAETKGGKRARVAVARKLAILLHRLWLSETEFRWA